MRQNSFFRWMVLGWVFSSGISLGAEPVPNPRGLILQTPPPISLNSVAVSPNGSLIATAADGVRLYDARTGALVRVIDAGGRVVAFAPDGRTLAAAGFHLENVTSKPLMTLPIYDVQTGKRVQVLTGHTEWETYSIAFSPDGKLFASAGVDKQILVWDLATGKIRHRLGDGASLVSALAFSSDSATLASGGGDKLVRLWDCTTGRVRKSLAGHHDWVCTIAFSPDGKTIASGSCDWGFHHGADWPRPISRGVEQSEWRLWDVESGKLQRTVAEPARMLSLAIAPGGKSLACGTGKEVRLYDLSSQGPSRVVTKHDADVTSVAFTPDGAAVVSGSHDQTVKYTRLATGTVEWEAPGYFEQVNSVALSDDASLLVTGSSDHRFAQGRLQAGAKQMGPGAVRLWDARTGRMLRRLGDPAEQVMAVALSPDRRYVAAGCGIERGEGAVHVWDVATGALRWSTKDHAREVLAVAFAPDGSLLATAAADGEVKLRVANTGQVAQTLNGHKGGATAVAFSPDGNTLYCAQACGGSRVWDVHTGRLRQTLHVADSQPEGFTIDRQTNSVGLSADGGTLATCASSTNGEFTDPVRIWDARTGALKRDFAAESIHGRPMAFSPDGSIIATGGKSVKLWDARTGRLLRELFGHLKRTQSITFSADGKLIVAGGSYGTTNFWEVASGRHLLTLFAFPDLGTNSGTDDWLAYTPQGYYDGSPHVERFLAWRVGDELQTPQTLAPQLHHPDRVAAALRLPFAERSSSSAR